MHEYLISLRSARMNAALHGSSAIRRFERSDAIEIRDGITFDFYTGLPQVHTPLSDNGKHRITGFIAERNKITRL